MQRLLLGLLSLALLLFGLYWLPVWKPEEENYLAYFCIKIGLVLGSIWLALPQVHSLIRNAPPWLWAVMGLGLIAIVFTKSFVIVVPLVAAICLIQFVGWMFKPPATRGRSSDRQRPSKPSSKGE